MVYHKDTPGEARMALVNYPIYKKLLASRKNKYTGEILKFSEKLMNHQ